MRNEDFYELVRKAREEQDTLLNVKGADYADQGVFGDEKLANFKEVERRLRGAPLDATTICAVYWLKHVIAMERWVRDRKVSSEPIEGRFDDESNYNLLLRANAQEYQVRILAQGIAKEAYQHLEDAAAEAPLADPINDVTQLTEEEVEEETLDTEWKNNDGSPAHYGTVSEDRPTCGCDILGVNCYCGSNEEEEEERAAEER